MEGGKKWYIEDTYAGSISASVHDLQIWGLEKAKRCRQITFNDPADQRRIAGRSEPRLTSTEPEVEWIR